MSSPQIPHGMKTPRPTPINKAEFIKTMSENHSESLAKFAMSGFNTLDLHAFRICSVYYRAKGWAALGMLQRDMEAGLFL